MFTIVPHVQGSEEWKNWRKDKIGASDMPTILKENPWKTPLMLWEEKMGIVEVKETFAMTRGKKMEEEARQWLNTKTGGNYQPLCVESNDYAWMISSLDGWDATQAIKGCEIKCPGPDAHLAALSGFVPDYYMAQIQHQMICTGQKQWLYCSYDGYEGVIVIVNLDRDYETRIIREGYAFHESKEKLKPPFPTDKDVIEIYDEDLLRVQESYLDINLKLKEFEAKEQELRKVLLSHVHHPRAKIGNIRLTKSLYAGSIEYDKIPELEGVNLDAYRKPPSERWRITCV